MSSSFWKLHYIIIDIGYATFLLKIQYYLLLPLLTLGGAVSILDSITTLTSDNDNTVVIEGSRFFKNVACTDAGAIFSQVIQNDDGDRMITSVFNMTSMNDNRFRENDPNAFVVVFDSPDSTEGDSPSPDSDSPSDDDLD